MPIELEGIYKWVVFLPSKVKKNFPVATRYFGAFEDGKLKARGLAFRRDDTPPLIKEAQQKMLDLLSACGNSQEYREKSREVREVLQDYLTRLETGDLKNEELLVAKSVRQKAKRVQGRQSHRPRSAAAGGIGHRDPPGREDPLPDQGLRVKDQGRTGPRLPPRQRR